MAACAPCPRPSPRSCSRRGVRRRAPAVFGTDDPSAIDRIIGRFCEARFGDPPAGGVFYRSSVGCVAGVCLADGRRVVLKAHQERWTKRFLEAVLAVQAHLDVLGSPVPSSGWPRPPPGPAGEPGDGRDMARRSRDERGQAGAGPACLRDGPGPSDRALPRPAGSRRARPLPPPSPRGGPLSRAAQPALRLRARRRVGVSDRRARRPRRYIRDHAGDDVMVIAHTDWSARNVRLHDGAVVAVYDWDSVARLRKSTAVVGQAAATWSVTSEPGGSVFPSAAVVAPFIDDYEKAAGHVWVGSTSGRRRGCRCGPWPIRPAVSMPWPRSTRPTGPARGAGSPACRRRDAPAAGPCLTDPLGKIGARHR